MLEKASNVLSEERSPDIIRCYCAERLDPGCHPRLWRRGWHSYARHGRSLGGESPLEEAVVLTPSRRQRRRREAGSEGSPRQDPAPRYTNRIEGEAIRMSRHGTAKSVTTKGSQGRCGGGRGKVVVLIRGLSGEISSRVLEMPVHCVRRVEVDHGGGNVRVQRREVSRGHSTGGDEPKAGKGRTHEPRATLGNSWVKR